MLILATLSLPAYDCATSSRIGAIILHGPHHSAQKSTRPGALDLRTCSSNWSSLTWEMAVLTVFSMETGGAGRAFGLQFRRSGGLALAFRYLGTHFSPSREAFQVGPSGTHFQDAPTPEFLTWRHPRTHIFHASTTPNRYFFRKLRSASGCALQSARIGIHALHADPGADSAACAAGPRCRRPGADRHRQDRRVPGRGDEPAADATGAARTHRQRSARADHRADA